MFVEVLVKNICNIVPTEEHFVVDENLSSDGLIVIKDDITLDTHYFHCSSLL